MDYTGVGVERAKGEHWSNTEMIIAKSYNHQYWGNKKGLRSRVGAQNLWREYCLASADTSESVGKIGGCHQLLLLEWRAYAGAVLTGKSKFLLVLLLATASQAGWPKRKVVSRVSFQHHYVEY